MLTYVYKPHIIDTYTVTENEMNNRDKIVKLVKQAQTLNETHRIERDKVILLLAKANEYLKNRSKNDEYIKNI